MLLTQHLFAVAAPLHYSVQQVSPEQPVKLVTYSGSRTDLSLLGTESHVLGDSADRRANTNGFLFK